MCCSAHLQRLDATTWREFMGSNRVVVVVESHQWPILQAHPLDHDEKQTCRQWAAGARGRGVLAPLLGVGVRGHTQILRHVSAEQRRL